MSDRVKLTAETLRRARAGDLELRKALLEHLLEPCDADDAFLLESPGLPLLDGQVDGLLLALADTAPESCRSAPAETRRPRAQPLSRPRRWVQRALPALAAAAVVSAVVLVQGLRPSPLESTVKGTPHVTLELEGALRQATGDVDLLPPGGRVPPTATLLLRYHATEATEGVLAMTRQGAPTASVLGRVSLEPGTHDLEREGQSLGVSLADEQGPVRVWLLARPGQVLTDAAVRGWLSGGGEIPGDVGRATVELNVESSGGHP